eukprot:CAMPEP_0117681794 /NCGR_PEP_ID=MMETSP0804-20121206/19209_1 /TAXON_ID=1074897 /ORGANISM="Tetraselmis astigmatica, Strain CCMP880" /LENGTH=81 /DNA_ID=CAMNT_0005491649 /DNA_START=312 /DNA_END=553 /DNA_ORIENTATION=+
MDDARHSRSLTSPACILSLGRQAWMLLKLRLPTTLSAVLGGAAGRRRGGPSVREHCSLPRLLEGEKECLVAKDAMLGEDLG